jgi:hypothetical protein
MLKKENRQGAKCAKKHFKWSIRADFHDPLGVLGVLAVRSSV